MGRTTGEVDVPDYIKAIRPHPAGEGGITEFM